MLDGARINSVVCDLYFTLSKMLFSGQSGGGVPDLRGMEKILPIVKYAYFGN